MSMLPLSIFSILVSFRGTFQAIDPNSTSKFKTSLSSQLEKIGRSKEIVEINMMKIWGIDYFK